MGAYRLKLTVTGCALVLGLNTACASLTPRDRYIDYFPAHSGVVHATDVPSDASLFPVMTGDQLERWDRNPINGVDDRTDQIFVGLTERFAPVLVKHTDASPWNFRKLLEAQEDPTGRITFDGEPEFEIDCWDLTRHLTNRLIDSISMKINADSVGFSSGTACIEDANTDEIPLGIESRGLLTLIERLRPDRPSLSSAPAERQMRTVLWTNFPGENESEWRRAAEQMAKSEDQLKRIYAHPFVRRVVTDVFEFVIQYWFFYPLNDGGNNHEGDWEHVNVRLGVGAGCGEFDGLLSGADVRAVLNPGDTVTRDRLTIHKVDYYFHHFVMTLDYACPTRSILPAQPRDTMQWAWLAERIVERRSLPDSLKDHPLGWIGADDVGPLLQTLRLPGDAINRDPHGTYPFPGVWKRVGPFGTTEKVGNCDNYPDDRLLECDEAVRYDSSQITVAPDWEPILTALDTLIARDEWGRADTLARDWAWLVLPIRWGYPLSPSPGAGAIRNADAGNAAPVGPAYNTAWNRTGATKGYDPYEPYIMPSSYGMGYQDYYNTDLGFLTMVRELRTVVPPISFIDRLANMLFSRDKKFFPRIAKDEGNPSPEATRRNIPFRSLSFGYRLAYTGWVGTPDSAEIIPRVAPPGLRNFLDVNPGSQLESASIEQSSGLAPISLYVTTHQGRLSSEAAFTRSVSPITYSIVDLVGASIGTVGGDRIDHAVTGMIFHSFGWSGVIPHVGVGYGLRWSKLDANLDGRELETYSPQTSRRGVCLIRLGAEWFPRRHLGIRGNVGHAEWGLWAGGNLHFDSCLTGMRFRSFDVGVGTLVSF